ncbi:MAG: hypothetical protein AAF289_06900 [Cyanobacteria bacterium P01_A01_bin.135]
MEDDGPAEFHRARLLVRRLPISVEDLHSRYRARDSAGSASAAPRLEQYGDTRFYNLGPGRSPNLVSPGAEETPQNALPSPANSPNFKSRSPNLGGRGASQNLVHGQPWDLTAIRRLLVMRLDNIGDVIMTAPTLRSLRQALPEAHITLLASPAGAKTAPLLSWGDEVIPWRALWQDLGKLPFDPDREW